jgi:hypothetical protein
LADKLDRKSEGLIHTLEFGLSNGRIEAVNNKVKVLIRMGYGFANIDNLIAMAKLKCNASDLVLPGRRSRGVGAALSA